jgi:hypothetical protein
MRKRYIACNRTLALCLAVSFPLFSAAVAKAEDSLWETQLRESVHLQELGRYPEAESACLAALKEVDGALTGGALNPVPGSSRSSGGADTHRSRSCRDRIRCMAKARLGPAAAPKSTAKSRRLSMQSSPLILSANDRTAMRRRQIRHGRAKNAGSQRVFGQAWELGGVKPLRRLETPC